MSASPASDSRLLPRRAGRGGSGGRLRQVLGCLAGAIAFLVFVGWLASCRAPEEHISAPQVVDEAGLLTPATIEEIESLSFPPGVPVLVRTVESIDVREIGSLATEALEDEEYWSEVRPRGFLRHYLHADPPWSRAIYVLVSAEPELLQVRFGDRIRLEAYRSQLAAGPSYRERQERFSLAAADQAVLDTVRWLADEVPEALRLPWLLRWMRPAVGAVFSESEELVAPGDGFFTQGVLKRYLKLMFAVGAAGSGWKFFLANLALIVVGWGLVLKLLIGKLIAPRLGRAGPFVTAVFAWALSLGLVATAFASLIVLGGGRLEDAMILEQLGIAGLGRVGFGPEAFAASTGILLALLGGAIVFFREMIEANAGSGPNQATLPLGGVVWVALLLFLPRPLALFAIGIQALRLVGTGVAVARSDEA